MTKKWHVRFLQNAQLITSWSKYPGHKVGCVVIDPANKSQLSGGFNGFPIGIKDDTRLQIREKAIKMVVHAEANAVAAAARHGHSLKGASLYTTHRPCSQCSSLIIQAGIEVVVSIHGQTELSLSGVDWKPEFDFATEMLMEANIQIRQVNLETGEMYRPVYDHTQEASPMVWVMVS